ncbi:NUDIX hydrolase [Rothia sp. P7181]|uniref:NUDIX hydrolase n=1 Tax=Rothia sp. P7181 TaxID=3402663 RepID=UPI003ADF0106
MPIVMETRPAAYAVIIEQGKILLTRFLPENAPERAAWTLPGGGMEPAEQPEHTVRREVLEETGYLIETDTILGVHALHLPLEKHQKMPFCALRTVYRAHIISGELTHETNGSSDQARWIPIEELDNIPKLSLLEDVARMMGYRNITDWVQQHQTKTQLSDERSTAHES